MALVNNANEKESRVCDTAVPAPGYVLKLVTATGHVDLAGVHEDAYGIAYNDTVEYVNSAWTAQAGKPVSIIREYGAIVNVRLLATNQAITMNGKVGTAAGGTVDALAYSVPPLISELRETVGIALESKLLNAGGTIKVMLGILMV